MDISNIRKFLSTPQDWNELSDERKATTLVLSFIGYVARPKNIPKNILEKCVKAFNDNRGKTEKEIDAVLKVIKNKEDK